jgi:hypothetical protein
MKGVETEFLMNYRVELAERSYSIGPTPVGQRPTGGIRGGSFEGPRQRGVVEAAGGDYARTRRSGGRPAGRRQRGATNG